MALDPSNAANIAILENFRSNIGDEDSTNYTYTDTLLYAKIRRAFLLLESDGVEGYTLTAAVSGDIIDPVITTTLTDANFIIDSILIEIIALKASLKLKYGNSVADMSGGESFRVASLAYSTRGGQTALNDSIRNDLNEYYALILHWQAVKQTLMIATDEFDMYKNLDGTIISGGSFPVVPSQEGYRGQ